MPDQTLRQPPAKPIDSTLQHGQCLVRQTTGHETCDCGGAAGPSGPSAATTLALGGIAKSRYTTTNTLPLDAEKKMASAVRFATQINAPIQTMLTINAAHLQRVGSDSVFDIGNLWDGYRRFLELLRKWVKGRGLPWSCIWAREYTGSRNEHHGEHWHIALHLPPRHRAALSAQIAVWTGDGVGAHDGKKKCITRSKTKAWYLSTRSSNAGEYLGKATPKTRRRYGRPVPNHQRQSFRHFGGEGPIEGKRFGISRHIGKTAQDRHGWVD